MKPQCAAFAAGLIFALAALLLAALGGDKPVAMNTSSAQPHHAVRGHNNYPPAAPSWETPFIPWKGSDRLHEPGAKDRPLLLPLTTALLRTVLPHSATFWGRNPDGGFRVFLRDKHVPLWIAKETPPVLPAESFFTATVVFEGLPSGTAFEFVLQLSINGSWYNHLNGTFETWPEEDVPVPSTNPLLFGFGSCINPNGENTHTGSNLHLLATLHPIPKFFFFLGDFIYFWDELPHNTSEYLRFYYRKLLTREVTAAMRRFPWMFQFDDHEVHNDYASEGDPSRHPHHAPAMLAWDHMIAKANPPPPADTPEGLRGYARWYQVSYGNTHYFIADVRSFKVNKPDLTGPLLGEVQLKALKAWFGKKCRKSLLAWCFFVSPTVFSHGSYRTDLWFGNMKEQKEVLDLFATGNGNDTSPLSILSGDSHVAAIWELAPAVLEFTCSPVDAFGILFPWTVPPRFRKYKRGKRPKHVEPWPALGDLPPPKAIAQAFPRHLGAAGYTCLVEASTSISPGPSPGTEIAMVKVRFDLIDGHAPGGGKLLNSHVQSYQLTRQSV